MDAYDNALNPQPVDPYDSVLNQQDDLAKQRLKSVLSLASDTNPDQAAKANQLAKSTGLPVDTVERNQAEVEKQERIRQMDIQRMMKESPILARQLSDPTFAKIAHDDTDNLGNIERRVSSGLIGGPAFKRGPDPAPTTFTGKLGAAFNRGLTSSLRAYDADAVLQSQELLQNIEAAERGDLDAVRKSASASLLIGANKDTIKSYRAGAEKRLADNIVEYLSRTGDLKRMTMPDDFQKYSQAKGAGETLSAFGDAPVSVTGQLLAQSTGQLLPTLPLMVGGGAAGGTRGLMMGTGASSFMTGYVNDITGILDEMGVDLKDTKAVRTAVASPDFKIRSAQAFVKNSVIGAVDAATAGVAGGVRLAKSGAGNLAAQTGVQMAGGAGGEVLGSLASGQEVSFNAAFSEAIAEIPGASFDAGVLASNKVFKGENTFKQAEQSGQSMQEIFDLAAQSKLRERDPETFKQFFQNSANAQIGEESTVFISPEKLSESLAQGGIDISALPSVAAQIDEIQARGGELEIPVGELVTALSGTGVEQSIIPYIRLDPSQPTLAESQADQGKAGEFFQQEAARIMEEKRQEEAFAQSAQEVNDTILTQLNEAARFSQDVNQGYAALIRDFFVTMADKAGQSPMEMYQQYPLKISAEKLGGSAFSERLSQGLVRDTSLSPEHGAIEKAAYEQIASNPTKIVQDYFERFGKTIDPDNVKEMFPAYANDKSLAAAVHEPSSYLSKLIFTQALKENKGKPVLFTAGGGGSGKSEAGDMARSILGVKEGGLVFDSTLSSLKSATKKIDEARASGAPVDIIYTNRQVNDAFKFAMGRDRVVPISVLAKAHAEASETIRKLQEHYKDDPEVQITVINNHGKKEDMHLGKLDDVFKYDYNEIERGLYDLAKQANETGTITADKYETLTRRTGEGSSQGIPGEEQGQDLGATGGRARSGHQGSDEGLPSGVSQQSLFQPRDATDKRGEFYPSANAISLLKSADLSTFLHESSHFFLTVYADIAAQPNAPQAIVDDMSSLLKWFGVSDLATWNAMSLDQQRQSHEKFAETFEQYLFSGKAPSVDLQPLFRRVASWMKKVYKSLQSFTASHPDSDINPEVSAIFDRMLATDEQIEIAQQARNYTALFETAEQGGMTEQEWQAYQATNEDASEDAKENLGVRALRDMKWLRNYRNKVIAGLQKEAAELRKQTKAEVAEEVAAQPVYRAMRFLKRGEIINEAGEVTTQEGNVKLDVNALETMYEGIDLAKLGSGKYGMTAQDGLSPDVVAEMFGFASGNQLVQSLLEAKPIKEVIEAETDQRMMERHGDLTDQATLDKAADEAVHNKMRSKAIATELRFLNEKLGSVQVIMKAAKNYAKDIVGRKKVSDVKPHVFAAAETRAAKAAEKALKSGDTNLAAKEKRTQVLNNAATSEAYATQREIEKTVRFFRKVATGDVSKNRDMDMVMAARAILAEYGIGTRGKQANEYLKSVESYDPAMYSVLRDRVDSALDNADNYKNITVDDFRNLKDEIESLWFLSKRSRQMEIDGDLMDRQDVQAALLGRMEEIGIPDTVPGEGKAVTPGEEALSMLQSFRASARRMESWVGSKDGNNPMGSFRKFIWTPVKEAADKYRTDKAAYLKKYRVLLDSIAPSLKTVKIDAPELGYVFGYDKGGMGKVELLHAILHTGNESNKRKLLLGRQWAQETADGKLDTRKWDAFIERMISEGHLNKADFDFAQGVWDLLDEMKPLAQKTHRAVFGRYFEEVTADGFTNQFGTYRGGYVPAMADSRIVADAKMRDLANQENESLVFAFPTTSKGFTKSRTEYNRPLMLDLRTLSSHIDKVLLFSHLEQPIRDVSKVLTSSEVSTALNRIDPSAYDGLLTPWLNRTAKQVVETSIDGSNGLMRFFSAARSRAGMAAMFANIANSAQQITGLSLAALKVKPKYLLASTSQFILNPRETAETVSSMSPYMATRMENEVSQMTGAINDILLNPSVYENAKNWASRHAYFMQSAVDNVIGPIVWIGAYNQAIETAPAGLSDSELQSYGRRLADSAVRETQGSTLPEDVSRIETGNAFVRMFTQFAGYFNMNANLLGTAFTQIPKDIGLRKGAGKGLYIVTLGFLAPAIVGELIMQAFKGGPDDEDKDGEYLDDWLSALFGWAPLRYGTAMVPVVGQTANAVANQFNNKPYDDRISTAPAISMIESAVKAPVSVYDAIVENGKPSKAIRDVATLISMSLGIPVNAAAKPISYLADVNAERVNPTSAADAIRGALTGTASPESK